MLYTYGWPFNDTIEPTAHESGQSIFLGPDDNPLYLFSDRDYTLNDPNFGPPGIALLSKDGRRLRSKLIANTGIIETGTNIIRHSDGNIYVTTDYWPNPSIKRGYVALYKMDDDFQILKQQFVYKGLVNELAAKACRIPYIKSSSSLIFI